MTVATGKTFHDHSLEVVSSFLQTVVVLDDEAFIQRTSGPVPANEEKIARLEEPDPRGTPPNPAGTPSNPAVNQSDATRPPSVGHGSMRKCSLMHSRRKVSFALFSRRRQARTLARRQFRRRGSRT